MLKSVYHFDQDRLSTADIESGYSVTKTLNNLYEKHGSLKKSLNYQQSSVVNPTSRLLTASQIIKANEKFARKAEVVLTNKQLDLIEILVRQKASMLLSALNESANMHKKQQLQMQQHQQQQQQSLQPQPLQIQQQQQPIPVPTPILQMQHQQQSQHQQQHLIQLDVNVVNDLKKATTKRMIAQVKPENKKLAIGSPLCCKSTSSISFTANIIEPSPREIKARRRNSIERLRSSSQDSSKKDFKTTKTKEYSNRYGKSKHRKSRKVTIMMKIKEESENELELEKNLTAPTEQDENKPPECSSKTREANTPPSTVSTITQNDYSSIDEYKDDLSELSDLSCSDMSVSSYRGVEDLDCYKDYKKILLSLAQKVPKKCSGPYF